MPTKNPKVSAYIPQHIFDCLKTFYEERNISMSQAVAIIFAEYFSVDYQVDQVSELPSGQILSKLQILEDKVNSFSNPSSELISELLSKVHSLSKIVISLENRINIIDKSNLKSELLSSSSNQQKLVSSEKIVVADNSQIELFSELLSSLSIKPLSTKLLASRLGVHNATISHTKAKLSESDFYSWLGSKDPDGIFWVNVDTNSQNYSKGYLPASGTPSELLSKLQIWLEQNQSQS